MNVKLLCFAIMMIIAVFAMKNWSFRHHISFIKKLWISEVGYLQLTSQPYFTYIINKKKKELYSVTTPSSKKRKTNNQLSVQEHGIDMIPQIMHLQV